MRIPKTWKQIAVGELARIHNRDDVFVVTAQRSQHAEILQITGEKKGEYTFGPHNDYAWPINIRQIVNQKSAIGVFKTIQKIVHDMEEK